MSVQVDVNGTSINYPQTGDTGWGDEATQFAIQVGGAFSKLGLDTGTTVDIPGTLDVTGATTLDSTLDVGSNLDVTGAGLFSSDLTIGGVLVADDSTSTSAPPITFTGDTNTGIGRSGADTLDFITNGNSRFRIESTGQIKAVYESQVGTDYNTQLDNGYLCRAWVNFNGTGTVAIRASGNVSSITDNNTGDYTVNFTTAMPDVNYSTIVSAKRDSTVAGSACIRGSIYSTSQVQIGTTNDAASFVDSEIVTVGIFR